MVSKARDFQDLSVVLFSDLDHGIHGMLKKVMTRTFGVSSLLKLMLSIKATPTQAAIAENAAPPDKDSPTETPAKDGSDDPTAQPPQTPPPDNRGPGKPNGSSSSLDKDGGKVDSDDVDNGDNPKSFKVVQS